MKTLTWQEAYSNMILDDFVEDKIRDLENAKEYRKLNYIEGKNDPEENKKKPAGAGIRVIESEEYKKFFAEDKRPSRSAFAGSGLALGAKVEIECWAIR